MQNVKNTTTNEWRKKERCEASRTYSKEKSLQMKANVHALETCNSWETLCYTFYGIVW